MLSSSAMEKVGKIAAREFEHGRSLVGRFAHKSDLVVAVEEFCAEGGIQMAVFSIIGAVMSVTLGTYDQKQQVYVTFKKEGPFEILYCTGNISLKDGKPAMHAHGVFADTQGNAFGGHIFSETIVYAGEMCLRELAGTALARQYDEQTGLYLWHMGGAAGC